MTDAFSSLEFLVEGFFFLVPVLAPFLKARELFFQF